jgi:hypothetical protein
MTSTERSRFMQVLETLYLFGMTGLAAYFAITILFLVGKRNEGFSQWYIILYGGGALLLLVYFFFMTILAAARIPEQNFLDFGFIAERDKYRFLSSVSGLFTGKQIWFIDIIFRFGPHLAFIIFAVMLSGVAGTVGYPVPNPFDSGGFTMDASTLSQQMQQAEQAYAVSPLKQAYFISVPVGFVEEGIILLLIEVLSLFMVIGYMVTMAVLKKPSRVPAGLHIVIIIIATFIASVGYAGIVPGFVDAHSSAYEANAAAYFKAFLFEFSGQMVNQFTGVFLSWIPHAAHNFMVSYLMVAGLSIGGTALGVTWLIRVRKNRKGEKKYGN